MVRLLLSFLALLVSDKRIHVASLEGSIRKQKQKLPNPSLIESTQVATDASTSATRLIPEYARAEALFWAARASSMSRSSRQKARAAAIAARVEAETRAEAAHQHFPDSGSSSTLMSYCNDDHGDEDGTLGPLAAGTEVDADWMRFGKRYHGRILRENEDGTYDVEFSDGWTEQGIPAQWIHVHAKASEKQLEEKQKQKEKDPACELKEMINTVKDEVQETLLDVAAFIAQQEEEEEEEEARAAAEAEEAEEAKGNENQEEVLPEDEDKGHEEHAHGEEDKEEAKEEDRADTNNEESKNTTEEEEQAAKEQTAKRVSAAPPAPAEPGKAEPPEGVTEKGASEEDKTVKEETNELKQKIKRRLENFIKRKKDLKRRIQQRIRKFIERKKAAMKRAAATPAPGKSVADEEEDDDPDTEGVGEEVRRLEEAATSAENQKGKVRMTEEEEAEVNLLKRKLRGVDAQEEVLEEETDKNNLKLNKLGSSNVSDNPLLEELRTELAMKKARVRELQMKEKMQEKKLAETRVAQGHDKHFNNHIKNLQAEIELIRKKREEFAKDGRLDSDLQVNIDRLLQEQKDLMDRVNIMKEAAKEAYETRQAAKAADQSQAVDAWKKATKAQKELVNTAETLGKDLRSVSRGVHELDTSVHPNGNKWWRYRYERAYIEAVVMIFIAFLMMLYETLLRLVRLNVITQARGGGLLKILWSQGTMYFKWIEQLLITLSSCLLVTLTIWIIDQCDGFKLLARCFHNDPTTKLQPVVHIPNTADEYRDVAMNVSMVLFFTVVLYSMATFSLVSHSMHILSVWAGATIGDTQRLYQSAFEITMTAEVSDFRDMEAYLENHAEEMHRMKVDDVWNYLRMSVRDVVDYMLVFGFRAWCSFFFTYIIIACLHRFFHWSYIIVFLAFSFLAGAYFTIMVGIVLQARSNIQAYAEAARLSASTPRVMAHDQVWLRYLRTYLGQLLQYNLYFLCFGAARMLAQRYMWQMHIYTVLVIAGLTLSFIVVFNVLIAPLIPTFAAAFALPPYIDKEHIAEMNARVQHEFHTNPKEFLDWYVKAQETPWLLPWSEIEDIKDASVGRHGGFHEF